MARRLALLVLLLFSSSFAVLGQSCKFFDSEALTLVKVSGRFWLSDGNLKIQDLGGNEAQAQLALKILDEYGVNRFCTFGSAGPLSEVMEYYLRGGALPPGPLPVPQLLCRPFNPFKLLIGPVPNVVHHPAAASSKPLPGGADWRFSSDKLYLSG